jgi:pimeloyl-ACP methyl ester carboxylesterase
MPRVVPAEHPPFAALPVRHVTVGTPADRMAVHVAGTLMPGTVPLICLAGYTRNMADFTDFLPLLAAQMGAGCPVILIDLRGRGRSADRKRAKDYSTLADAEDVAEIARAFAIERAVFLGQGHGGQVIMALAARRPSLIGGTILLDAGPAISPPSLVRLRSNAQAIAGLRGEGGLTVMLRRMLAADYPGRPQEQLDRLAGRSHFIDAKGAAIPLFDRALIDRLKGFEVDDMVEPQWQLFDLLGHAPMLIARSELTDQLTPGLLAEMQARRPDAVRFDIAGQGSPALLDRSGDVEPIARFLADIGTARERQRRQG